MGRSKTKTKHRGRLPLRGYLETQWQGKSSQWAESIDKSKSFSQALSMGQGRSLPMRSTQSCTAEAGPWERLSPLHTPCCLSAWSSQTRAQVFESCLPLIHSSNPTISVHICASVSSYDTVCLLDRLPVGKGKG